MENPKYGRILLKLSGEILAGDTGFGIDPKKASYLAKEVKSIFNKGWKIKKEEFPKESIKTRIGREKLIIFEKV